MPFVKLDTGILNSTLWVDKDARDIFITALLMAHPIEITEDTPQLEVRSMEQTGFVVPPGWYGFVPAAGTGIINQAGMIRENGLAALERCGAPDFESRSSDFEGRRMVRVDGGFILLNYDKYRQRDYGAAERARRYRQRHAQIKSEHEQSQANGVTSRANGVTSRPRTQAEAEAEADSNTSTPLPPSHPPAPNPPATPPAAKPPKRGDWREKAREDAISANSEPLPAEVGGTLIGAWADWCAHRSALAERDKSKPWTKVAARNELRNLADAIRLHGAESVMMRVREALAGSWQGLNLSTWRPTGGSTNGSGPSTKPTTVWQMKQSLEAIDAEIGRIDERTMYDGPTPARKLERASLIEKRDNIRQRIAEAS
jgi:hypothetical protein